MESLKVWPLLKGLILKLSSDSRSFSIITAALPSSLLIEPCDEMFPWFFCSKLGPLNYLGSIAGDESRLFFMLKIGPGREFSLSLLLPAGILFCVAFLLLILFDDTWFCCPAELYFEIGYMPWWLDPNRWAVPVLADPSIDLSRCKGPTLGLIKLLWAKVIPVAWVSPVWLVPIYLDFLPTGDN